MNGKCAVGVHMHVLALMENSASAWPCMCACSLLGSLVKHQLTPRHPSASLAEAYCRRVYLQFGRPVDASVPWATPFPPVDVKRQLTWKCLSLALGHHADLIAQLRAACGPSVPDSAPTKLCMLRAHVLASASGTPMATRVNVLQLWSDLFTGEANREGVRFRAREKSLADSGALSSSSLFRMKALVHSRACELVPGHAYVYGQLNSFYVVAFDALEFPIVSVSVFAAVRDQVVRGVRTRHSYTLPRIDMNNRARYVVPMSHVDAVSVMMGHVPRVAGVYDVMCDGMEWEMSASAGHAHGRA